MVRHPAQRLMTTLLVVFSLLFSHLALANYVCPALAQAEMPIMQMASGEPCEAMSTDARKVMDQEQPGLCHQHCINAPQSDGVKLPSVSLPAVVQGFVVPNLVDVCATASVVFAQAVRERPPPDPLFLSTLRLRV